MPYVTTNFPLLRQTEEKKGFDPFEKLLNDMEDKGYLYVETYKPRPGKMVRNILFKYVGEGAPPEAKELPKTTQTGPKMPDTPAAKPGNDFEPTGDDDDDGTAGNAEGDPEDAGEGEPAAKPKATPKAKQSTGLKAKPVQRRSRRKVVKPAAKPAAGDK